MEYRFTIDNFQGEVLDSKQPVLIDFYADWCGPCKMMAPTVQKVADEYDGRLKVGKVNTDEQPDLAQAFQVMSIPSLFIIRDGKVVDKMVGTMPKHDLEKRIDAALA